MAAAPEHVEDLRSRLRTRPLVLLDVDGVLNAVPHSGASPAWPEWCTGHAVAQESAFRITWSPTVVDAVRGWTELADVQWLTTWGHDANTSLRHLLELPELPVAGTHDEEDAGGRAPGSGAHADVAPAAPEPLTGRWWKFDVVRRIVGEQPGRRIVWVDDDLVGEVDIQDWVRDAVDCLLVVPHPASGLTEDDLAAIDAYLRR